MRKLLVLSFTLAAVCSAAAQNKFPGISPTQMQKLNTAKKQLAFPLPTWLPAGFALDKVETKLGRRVPLEEKAFTVVYSKRLPSGKTQRFAIEAGFDGLGDLPYESGRKVRSTLGEIWLAYQPKDEDGKKLVDFAMTEWFSIGNTAFHYDGAYGFQENDRSLAMISLADTERILRSLRRF